MAKICKDCGTVGDAKVVTKGSFLIEVVLWLCFLIPGLIYSLWRLTTRHKCCKACGGSVMLPLNSPAGIKLMAEYDKKTI